MTTEEELEHLRAENAALRERVAELESQVQALQDSLAKDSHNSSLPPSSDRFHRRPRSLRQKSGKKPGGQLGHPGHHLAFSQTPDQIEVHPVTQCAYCHADLQAAPAKEVERRQIVEWPVQRVRITEHRIEEKSCPQCQHRTRAAFPAHLRGPIQYGASLQALAVYLVQYHLLPYARVSELFHDLLGLTLSPGTIQILVQQGASTLEPMEAAIKAALMQAPVIHQDETGIYVNGGTQWVHVCSTPTLTHYAIHPKRGSAAIEAIGILPHYQGVSVHDSLRSYERYFCEHALCNVHHLRELTFVAEEYQQAWADQLKMLLLEMKHAVEQAKRQGQSELGRLERARLRWRYEEVVAEGLAQNPLAPPAKRPGCKRVGNKQSHPRNLLDRLSKKQEQVLRFLDDFTVPFDNNQAERDLRMVKVQQKVSGCFRTDQGAAAFGRIRGYLSTLRKQGQPLFAALEQLLQGQPLFPALGPPSPRDAQRDDSRFLRKRKGETSTERELHHSLMRRSLGV